MSMRLPVNIALRVPFSPATRTSIARLRGGRIRDRGARLIESARVASFQVIAVRIHAPLR